MMEYWLFPVRVAAILVVCSGLRMAAASWWYLAMAGAYPRLAEDVGTTSIPGPEGSASSALSLSTVSAPPMVMVTPSASPSSSRGQVVVAVKGGRRRQQLLRLACSDLPYLGQRQRELCALDRSLIHIIGRGAHMGIQECQHQFRDRRWNCSTFNEPSVFGNILSIQSRETAFIYAISSAGVMYSVTRACSKGQLLRCTCDARVGKRHATDGTFEWGGCSDNVRFGSRFSKDFVDSNEQQVTAQGLMNLWNNGAGRKTTKESLEVLCKCHGVSGSCSVKICWRKLQPFRAIGAKLKAKFDGASLVMMDGKRRRLKRVTRLQKQPRKTDLVYLRESPDFCQLNREVGSLGTHGRRCNKTSYGLDGCTLMCCGRGYHTLVRTESESCDCKFHWCCSVECKQCTRVREMNYCN